MIEYFSNARRVLGVTSKEINQAIGKQMASHWFSESQWQLPAEKDYLALQTLFEEIALAKGLDSGLRADHGQLQSQYHSLSLSYAKVMEQHKKLRRPFAVTSSVPFTDVWIYKSVPFYAGKHPCEKPAARMEDIINASSNVCDVVADFFIGSGATIKAAKKLGRFALGVEMEREKFEQTSREISDFQ